MERYIVEFPGAIPEDLCNRLIKKFENDTRKTKGVIGGENSKYVDEKIKKSMEIVIPLTTGWEQEDTELHKYTQKVVKKYIKYIVTDAFKEMGNKRIYADMLDHQYFDSGFSIQRIARGDAYAWHHDGLVTDGGRVCNILMYLNTLEEHEGGTTEFHDGTKIRPEIGKIVMFPSSWTFPHRGNVVNVDYKYICCGQLRVKLIPQCFENI